MADHVLDNIVKVTITRQTSVPSMASFSDHLIVDTWTGGSITQTDRVQRYGGLSELVDAGFATTTFAYRAAQKQLSQSPHIGTFFIGRRATGETWEAALNAILAENNEWYALTVSTRVLAEQQTVASWAQANEKLCILATGDANVVDAATGDLADWARTNNLSRVAVFYHPDVGGANDPIPEAAYFGKMLTKHPGSATWALKNLESVPTYNLSAGQYSRARAKNASIYVRTAGLPIIQDGQVAAGEYIDVIHGLDWLKARLQNLIFTPMVQRDKIPFTDDGIQTIVSQLRAGLDEGVRYEILTSNYTIDYPEAANVAQSFKGTRTLPDLRFTAPLAGAIQHTQIEGTITL